MNFRNKLLLSFLIFIAALVALGVWSAWRLRELGSVSQRIIAHNYDSVIAAQDMKESLERMDSAALFLLSGNRERATEQFNEYRARFDSAFEESAGNVTEPGEVEISARSEVGRGATITFTLPIAHEDAGHDEMATEDSNPSASAFR